MFKNLKKKQEGFTIIEVMIVLVIAAVILLIVFLAVPALQRNSRNTQRKNDVAGLLSAVNEWSNNNGGKYPVNSTQNTAALKNVKTGFYDSTASYSGSGDSAVGVHIIGELTNRESTESVAIVTNAKCNADGENAERSSRSLAALYVVETGAGTKKICQSS